MSAATSKASRVDAPAEHPAEYTAGILEGVEQRSWLPETGRILDPFGGAGRKLHQVLSRPGRQLVAVEIEPAFVERWPEYLTLGDATDLPFPDGWFDAAITSPPYAGVRFADYNRPKAPQRWRGRRGYDVSAKWLTGDPAYILDRRNIAAHVRASGTGPEYWNLCAAAWRELPRVLTPGAPFVFNHAVRSGDATDLGRHLELLAHAGLTEKDRFYVASGGYQFGANLTGRRNAEAVVLMGAQ